MHFVWTKGGALHFPHLILPGPFLQLNVFPLGISLEHTSLTSFGVSRPCENKLLPGDYEEVICDKGANLPRQQSLKLI